MELLKPAIVIRLKMLFLLYALLSAVFVDCSEFNQPITPVVPFTRGVYFPDSSSGISFYYDARFITLRVNRDSTYDVWQKASLFIKVRNENEYITGSLSDMPFDFRMDIIIDSTWFTNGRGHISYRTLDSHGDTLHSGRSHIKEDRTSLVTLGEELPLPASLFFWQIEFYFESGITGMGPKIWYFGLTDK